MKCIEKITNFDSYLILFSLNSHSHILISLHILSFVEMIKWAYVSTLLNPVLSDSFGLSMSVSSYFYLGLAVPRILGAVVL